MGWSCKTNTQMAGLKDVTHLATDTTGKLSQEKFKQRSGMLILKADESAFVVKTKENIMIECHREKGGATTNG